MIVDYDTGADVPVEDFNWRVQTVYIVRTEQGQKGFRAWRALKKDGTYLVFSTEKPYFCFSDKDMLKLNDRVQDALEFYVERVEKIKVVEE